MGIKHSTISAWKNRNTNPPLDFIPQICDFLDVDVYDLLEIEPKHQDEIVTIYNQLTPEDKAIVDSIFNKYRESSGKSSSSEEAM